jgi:hypothetical protein
MGAFTLEISGSLAHGLCRHFAILCNFGKIERATSLWGGRTKYMKVIWKEINYREGEYSSNQSRLQQGNRKWCFEDIKTTM